MSKREILIDRYGQANSGKITDFSYYAQTNQVSWKCPGECPKGAMERIRFDVHLEAGWLQIDAAEGYDSKKGSWVGREVMLTMNHDEALALRDFLNANLPEKGEQAA